MNPLCMASGCTTAATGGVVFGNPYDETDPQLALCYPHAVEVYEWVSKNQWLLEGAAS